MFKNVAIQNKTKTLSPKFLLIKHMNLLRQWVQPEILSASS